MKLVVVGNGVAGVMTARFVAQQDPDTEISIFSCEPYPYYPRPKLIDVLAGKVAAHEVFQYPDSWYANRGIRLLQDHRVIALYPSERRIELANGSVEGYDKLVLATGASPWVPPIPGTDKEGVYTFRRLSDVRMILDAIEHAQQAVIIGGGLLGIDTSMALMSQRVKTVLIEALPRLLPKQLDQQGAAVLQGLLEGEDRQILTGALCQSLKGDGHVQAVRLANGDEIPADLVIISVGVRPRKDLAEEAGLACARGIMVNERMETSDPNIYAVGDAASFRGTVWAIIPAALSQARVAAAQITGKKDTLYDGIVPSTSLKVTDVDLVSIGDVNPEGNDYVELRKSEPHQGTYKKLVLHQGRLVGAILLGDLSDMPAVRRLIESRADLSQHQPFLLSDTFELSDLL